MFPCKILKGFEGFYFVIESSSKSDSLVCEYAVLYLFVCEKTSHYDRGGLNVKQNTEL